MIGATGTVRTIGACTIGVAAKGAFGKFVANRQIQFKIILNVEIQF